MAANRPGETAVAAGPAATRQSQSRWSLDMVGSRVKAVVLGSYSENVTSACAVSLRTFESAMESGLVERGAAVVVELVDETRDATVVELVDETVDAIVVLDVFDVVDVDTVVVDVGLTVVERVVVDDVVVVAVLELALFVDRVLGELSRSTTEGFAVVVELEEIIAEPSVETSQPNVVLIFSSSNCSSVRLRSVAASPNSPVKCWIIRSWPSKCDSSQLFLKIIVKSKCEESLPKEFLQDSYLGVDCELPDVGVLALGHVAGLLVRCQDG